MRRLLTSLAPLRVEPGDADDEEYEGDDAEDDHAPILVARAGLMAGPSMMMARRQRVMRSTWPSPAPKPNPWFDT